MKGKCPDGLTVQVVPLVLEHCRRRRKKTEDCLDHDPKVIKMIQADQIQRQVEKENCGPSHKAQHKYVPAEDFRPFHDHTQVAFLSCSHVTGPYSPCVA